MSDDRLCNLSFLSIEKELIALMIKSRPEKWHMDMSYTILFWKKNRFEEKIK